MCQNLAQLSGVASPRDMLYIFNYYTSLNYVCRYFTFRGIVFKNICSQLLYVTCYKTLKVCTNRVTKRMCQNRSPSICPHSWMVLWHRTWTLVAISKLLAWWGSYWHNLAHTRSRAIHSTRWPRLTL